MKKEINWFIDLYRNGQLNLDPSYQRRSVWTLKDQKFFLDTIFRHYPCPPIFVHKTINEEARKIIYNVVDGKQRLETIMRFAENDISIDKDYGEIKLNGKKWKSIENEIDLSKRFLHYMMSVEFIDKVDGIVINQIFDRLNRNSRKLERQELRHAKYEGWLISTAETEAEKDEWEKLGVSTKARTRRMKDVQFISELLIVILKNLITGFDQDYIDDIYVEYDSPHDTVKDFREEDFNNRLQFVKDYIIKMENHNQAITKYARGFGNFYSLWAFIVLNQRRLQPAKITAERYSEFMSKVEILAREKDPEKFLKEHKNNSYSEAYIYFRNSVQASTDQKQRQERNWVLESVLLN